MQRTIIKDLLTYLPGKILPALAGFITLPIYTPLFPPEQYGYYALATAAAEFLLLGTATTFGQAAVRFFSAFRLKSNLSSYFSVVFGSMALITLTVCAACGGILLVLHPFINTALYPLLWDALLLYGVSAWSAILMDVLRGQEKGRWYSFLWTVQVYIGIILGLVLVLVFRTGIGGLISGQTLGILLTIPVLIWLVARSNPIRFTFNRPDFAQVWAFALPFTVGNIAFWSLSLADRYVIEMFRGSYEVGVYSVATKLSSRSVQLLVGLFFLVPAPIISRLWEERGRQATEEALMSFTRMFFLMIIPAVVGLSVVAVPLLQLLADEAYFSGYSVVWLVACASMGLGLSDLGSIGCMVTNQTRLIARNQCIAAVACLGLNFLLVPRMGFTGAALSGAIAFFLLAGLQALSSARYLTWRWPFGSLWRVLAASTVMAGTVFLIQASLQPDKTFLRAMVLLLSVVSGSTVYGLVLIAVGEISPKQLRHFFARADHGAAPGQVAGETPAK